MTAEELVRAADESFIASFRKLAQHVPEGETHEAGSIFSFVTGLPSSGFNGCVATQETSSDELAVSLAWVAARDVPFRVWVAEKLAAGLAEVASSYALQPAASLYPGMVLRPIPDPLAMSPGVSVVSILEPSLEEFIGVLEESGLRPELAIRLITPSFAADPDVQLFVGRLDGKPGNLDCDSQSRRLRYLQRRHPPRARRRGSVAPSPGPQSKREEPGDTTPSCFSLR